MLGATAVILLHPGTCPADAANNAPERTGIYDSRALAYAEFWSEANQSKLKETVRRANEAKTVGQIYQFNELIALLKQKQEQNHLQVFSTAPVDEILDRMKQRVEAVRKETGVTRLIPNGIRSHWPSSKASNK